jgi:hypothetical protein
MDLNVIYVGRDVDDTHQISGDDNSRRVSTVIAR